MFSEASTFNRNLNDRKTGRVTSIQGMFARAKQFNGLIGSWDTSQVTSLDTAFSGAAAFQGNGIALWDTSRVTTFASFELTAPAEAGITACNKRKIADVWSTESTSTDERTMRN